MKIDFMDKISNDEVLAQVNETKTMLSCMGQETSLDWIGHVFAA